MKILSWCIIAVLGLAFLSVCGTATVSAESFPQAKQVVAKINARRGLTSYCGTAWCLDVGCDVLVTSYHFVKIAGPGGLKIDDVKVKDFDVNSATGDSDPDAQILQTAAGPIRLAWIRDFSLVTLKAPLSLKELEPVTLYTEQLQPGQKVVISGFPDGKLRSIRGKFMNEESPGLLLFELEQSAAPGFSGGLIADEQGRAVGLLFALAEDNPRLIYAVPIWSLADFVRKVKPRLYRELFPGELYHPQFADAEKANGVDVFQINFPSSGSEGFSPSPMLPETYLLYDDVFDTEPVQARDASTPVLELRRAAQHMVEMKNFIARQILIMSNGHAWQHELQMIDGRQRFRPFDGGHDRFELPIPDIGPVPGAEWSSLVRLISNPSLPLRSEREMKVGHTTVMVLRYEAKAEDNLCRLKIARTFRTWVGPVNCTGLIWTDEQFQPLRIAEELRPPDRTKGVASMKLVLLYGWWAQSQKLVPVEMYLRTLTTHGKIFAARVRFDNYRVFTTSSRISFVPSPRKQKHRLTGAK